MGGLRRGRGVEPVPTSDEVDFVALRDVDQNSAGEDHVSQQVPSLSNRYALGIRVSLPLMFLYRRLFVYAIYLGHIHSAC